MLLMLSLYQARGRRRIPHIAYLFYCLALLAGGELRRIPLLGRWVNKGLGSLVCRLTPEPGGPSRNGYGPPDGYKLAYSVPCANPYHHLPEEAPRLHTPVHVPLHVPPKWRVLSPFQVRVRYNQH